MTQRGIERKRSSERYGGMKAHVGIDASRFRLRSEIRSVACVCWRDDIGQRHVDACRLLAIDTERGGAGCVGHVTDRSRPGAGNCERSRECCADRPHVGRRRESGFVLSAHGTRIDHLRQLDPHGLASCTVILLPAAPNTRWPGCGFGGRRRPRRVPAASGMSGVVPTDSRAAPVSPSRACRPSWRHRSAGSLPPAGSSKSRRCSCCNRSLSSTYRTQRERRCRW